MLELCQSLSLKKTEKIYKLFYLPLLILTALIVAIMTPKSVLQDLGLETESKAATTLSNPTIVSDSSMRAGQKVTWDCVWFGSYPQTEIVDQASTSGCYGKVWSTSSDYVVNATLYNSLKSASWDSNGDTSVNGIKYHRIQISDISLNGYSEDWAYNWSNGVTYHYFRYEPIKWRVLKISGSTAFLLADKAIDDQVYNTTEGNMTWEKCTIRSWLNGYSSSENSDGKDYTENNFIGRAFSATEKSEILTTEVVNNDNIVTGAEGGNNTSDKIFFLSESELYSSESEQYGFKNSKLLKDEARRSKSSTYAKAMGSSTPNDSDAGLGNCFWWLRSPSNYSFDAERISNWGDSYDASYSITNAYNGCRPALNLNISSSSTYLYAGTVSSDNSINENPAYTYVITFNANNGSGVPSTISKIGTDTSVVMGDIGSTVPTRTGYTFHGWSASSSWSSKRIAYSASKGGGTTSDGTSATTTANTWSYSTYCSNTGGSTSNTTLTLYAQWQPNTYSVTFNANGGSGAPSSQTKTYGTALTLSTTIPTRSGYTFVGWGTSSSATTATYSAGSTYTTNAAITLYAIWKKTITLTYDANNGIGAPSSQSETIYNATSSYTFTISSTIPTREGYNFLGWSTSSSAVTASYTSGNSYTLSSNSTLYAVWEVAKFTVTYDANGGEGAPAARTGIVYGTNISLSSLIPTRVGCIFKGWATNAAATSASYAANDGVTVTNNLTLYAVWAADSTTPTTTTYIVTYNANGGSGAPSSQVKTQGVALTLSSTVPTRSGYTFLGWSTSSSASSASYASGSTYSTDANVNLYAVWKENSSPSQPSEDTEQRFTVSYDANGGSGVPASVNINKGAYIQISNVAPARGGYIFRGWALSSSAASPAYAPGDGMVVNQNIVLYAVWQRNQQQQVITASSMNVAYKSAPFYLGATTNGDGALSYSSSNPGVANVSNTGLVTVGQYGITQITITASATTNFNSASTSITITVGPKPVTIKKAVSKKKKQLVCTWKKNKEATGYQMYISLSPNFDSYTFARNCSKKYVKYTFTGLRSKNYYYVKSRCYKKIGGMYYFGPWSNVKRVKIK